MSRVMSFFRVLGALIVLLLFVFGSKIIAGAGWVDHSLIEHLYTILYDIVFIPALMTGVAALVFLFVYKKDRSRKNYLKSKEGDFFIKYVNSIVLLVALFVWFWPLLDFFVLLVNGY